MPLSGKNGVLAPLLEHLLNSALEGKMDSHLDRVEREICNRRNGHMSKQVQTTMGEITINTHTGTATTLSISSTQAREDPRRLPCRPNHRPVRHQQQHKGR